jgi:TonB family protein
VHDGQTVYTLRNVAFTPLRVRELQTLLRFAKDPSQLTAEGMKERHGRDGDQVCIRVSLPDPSRLTREVCVDPASHDIVREEYDSFEGTSRTMYKNYAEFNGLRFPRKLEFYVDKNMTISATVVALETREFDLGLLTPPQGAIERRDCARKIHPVPIKTPQPDVLPSPARTANAMLAITVQKDGSVSDIVAIGGSTHSLDRVTIDALKAWKFKPAMCGDEAVVDDITINMQYGNH